MQRKPTIGIYSGVVPSTTFIERMLRGLAAKDFQLLHFGVKEAPVSYPNNLKAIGYRNRKLSKLHFYIKYWMLLSIFKRKQKRRLDRFLEQSSRNNINHKLRAYPVLWHHPDILHIQWAKTIDHWMWVQDFGIKLVLSLRGAHINYSPLANAKLAESYKKNFPKIDGFHAVSRAISKEAQKYNAHPERIQVVYSGLENISTKLEEKPIGNPISIISVSRDHWIKGNSDAIDAIYLLKQMGYNIHYTIVGAVSSVESLYQIKDLNLESEVSLLTELPFEQVQNMITASDILLLSSLKEGVANVVLEAMAMGTLVVSTDCGGMSEVISDGENGFLVPIRRPMAMAQRIETILKSDAQHLKAIRINALNTIKEHHTMELMVQGMSDLYLKTVNFKNSQE